VSDIADLIERTRQTGDPAAQQLADIVEHALAHPDRRVGAALQPQRRGGEPQWLADQRAARDDAYRDLARAEYGSVYLARREAKALARKATQAVNDARAVETESELKQDAIRRIRATGLKPLGERQLLRILPAGEKKL
jgi:hypothetical protein